MILRHESPVVGADVEGHPSHDRRPPDRFV